VCEWGEKQGKYLGIKAPKKPVEGEEEPE